MYLYKYYCNNSNLFEKAKINNLRTIRFFKKWHSIYIFQFFSIIFAILKVRMKILLLH